MLKALLDFKFHFVKTDNIFGMAFTDLEHCRESIFDYDRPPLLSGLTVLSV